LHNTFSILLSLGGSKSDVCAIIRERLATIACSS
jgi:hypothetical protein